MTTKKKVILGISIATIVGVGGYFLYKYIKDKQDEGGEETDDGDATVTDTKPGADQGSKPSRSPGSASSSKDRPDDVLEFQKYANGQGYTPKLVEDGLWGPKTSAAWKKHKDGYKKVEGTAKATGELTGQAKKIYEALEKSKGIKNLTVVKNSKGTNLIKGIGAKTGFTYYWATSGQFFAYDKSKPQKSLATGDYANNGKTLVVKSGVMKGKTVTSSTVTGAAYKAIDGSRYFPSMTDAQIQQWIFDVYALFKKNDYKGGTSWYKFDDYWKKLKTVSDWSKVFHAYGKKDGKNLFEAIQYYVFGGTTRMNETFKNWGSSNRFR